MSSIGRKGSTSSLLSTSRLEGRWSSAASSCLGLSEASCSTPTIKSASAEASASRESSVIHSIHTCIIVPSVVVAIIAFLEITVAKIYLLGVASFVELSKHVIYVLRYAGDQAC